MNRDRGLSRAFVAAALSALLSGGSCDRHEASSAAAGAEQPVRTTSAAAESGAEKASLSAAPFSKGEEAFRQVKEALRSKYYRSDLSDDELYRAAVAGMLQLLEPQLGTWNKLLTPEEVAELQADMKGNIVGIGVQIRFDDESGISDVLSVIPGSPAERAGLHEGDKILTVSGKFYKGKTLRDVVADLRGQAGETVKLAVLRGTEVQTFLIQRQRIAYDTVKTLLLPGEVGYLGIHQFTENTPSAVGAALKELLAKRVRGLVIDVRGNQGGLFDQAIKTAELFLKKGTPIAKIRRRGGELETVSSSELGQQLELPLALLIDHETASSGELLAGALHEGAEAQLIGERTFGKGTVQHLEELPNHYAFKYTVSHFLLPSGQPIEKQGLTPDVEVLLSVPESSNYERQLSRVQHLFNPTERLQADTQLRAAVNVLGLRTHPSVHL